MLVEQWEIWVTILVDMLPLVRNQESVRKSYRGPKEVPMKRVLRILLIAFILMLLLVVTASYMQWH